MKKRIHRLAGSEQCQVGSVDLALTSPVSVTIRNLVFAEGKQENLPHASWKSCLDIFLVSSAAGNIDVMF